MIDHPINSYFRKKGMDVWYNTLNSSELLLRAYAKDYQNITDQAKDNWSHHVKPVIYASMYDIAPRKKLTGFESFKKQDRKFRDKTLPLIRTSQFSNTMLLSKTENSQITISYKDALKQRLREFKDPLLYYSGGLDSELVALAMIDAGIKFTPVIFELIDDSGAIKNDYDLSHAYSFCKKHHLLPIVKTLNVDELWASKEFENLAIELQITSPQIVTHAYMVEIMQYEYRDRSHLFGGEVRFYSNHMFESDVPSNMIILNKLAGLGINGISYIDDYAGLNPAPDTGVGVYITDVASGGYVEFLAITLAGGSGQYPWYSTTGTPSPIFYYAVTSVNINISGTATGYTTTPVAPTPYSFISNYSQIAYCSRSGDAVSYVNMDITLSVYGSNGGESSAISGSFSIAGWRSL